VRSPQTAETVTRACGRHVASLDNLGAEASDADIETLFSPFQADWKNLTSGSRGHRPTKVLTRTFDADLSAPDRPRPAARVDGITGVTLHLAYSRMTWDSDGRATFRTEPSVLTPAQANRHLRRAHRDAR